MGLGEAILAVGAGARPASFEQLAAAIEPQWIDDALAATGTASVRRRKLPAERDVWLVSPLPVPTPPRAGPPYAPYRTTEGELATTVWATIPDHAVVILDRGFARYALFHALADAAHQRHWLLRARRGRTALKGHVVER